MFTLYRVAYVPARKSDRIRLLPHMRTAIWVLFRSKAAPCQSQKWIVTHRIGSVSGRPGGGGGVALHLGAVLTGIRTVAEGNKKDRGLEPTETEVNIFKSKDWDL